MLKKHTFSPNHKVVESSPHNFSPGGGSAGPGNMQSSGSGMHPSAEPAGGGAAGPAPQMFSDGGDILGGGIRGKMSDYGSAIKQTASDMLGAAKSDPVADAQKAAQSSRNKSIDDTVRSAETGDDS